MNLSDPGEQALSALRHADTHLVSTVGWYGLSTSGTARGPGPDGALRSSLFDYCGGAWCMPWLRVPGLYFLS